MSTITITARQFNSAKKKFGTFGKTNGVQYVQHAVWTATKRGNVYHVVSNALTAEHLQKWFK
jgi:hypothetical protein